MENLEKIGHQRWRWQTDGLNGGIWRGCMYPEDAFFI
jgi:hypothetical protein